METKEEIDSVGRILMDIEHDIGRVFDIQNKLYHKFGALRRAMVREARKPLAPKAAIEAIETKPVNNEKTSLTIRQFCKEYNMAVSTFYRIKENNLAPKTSKIGHKVLIMREDIEVWKLTLKK